MAKGIGIAALIIALIAFGIPLFGIFVSWFAVALAVIAALFGDRIFAVATPIISTFNIALSPTAWAAFAGEDMSGSNPVLWFTIILFISPFVAIFLNTSGKIALGKATNNDK